MDALTNALQNLSNQVFKDKFHLMRQCWRSESLGSSEPKRPQRSAHNLTSRVEVPKPHCGARVGSRVEDLEPKAKAPTIGEGPWEAPLEAQVMWGGKP